MSLHALPTPETKADPDHLTRTDYEDVASALVDARRALSDIVQQLEGSLLVKSEELDFLARRAQALIDACQRAVDESAAS